MVYAPLMRTGLISAFLLLAACAGPHVTSATPAGGIVSSYGWQPNKALQLANQECAKHGKAAVVTSENDAQDHMTYECVAQ
jgi:hypothetical protein